jgi:hypothetical protein
MTQYLLSVCQPAGLEQPAPEALAKIMDNVAAFRQELQDAGAWVFSGGLHAPSTATVVQAKDGRTVTTDGPFLEGKEYIGGFTILTAPDLDAALEWGRKCALAIPLPIEVRPFVDESGD